MASVHVGPDDKQIVMRGSETILAASLREGIPHAYACGGRARCSICRISSKRDSSSVAHVQKVSGCSGALEL